jgi:uncharacterized protein (TIGR02246 family)
MTEDERAIRALVQRWMDATRANDAETVLELMADDAIFMVPGTEPFGKEAFRAAMRHQSGMTIDGHSEIIELNVLGDWAYMRSHIDVTMTPEGGQPLRRSGYTLTVLRKAEDGRWRLACDANLVT